MSNLSDLRVALVQPELFEGCPGRTRNCVDGLLETAAAQGAHVAVVPGLPLYANPDSETAQPTLVGLNGTHVEGAQVLRVDCDGETYRVFMHEDGKDATGVQADLAVLCTKEKPWTVDGEEAVIAFDSMPTVLPRFVGMANRDDNVWCYSGQAVVAGAHGSNPTVVLRGDFESDVKVLDLSGELGEDSASPRLLDALTSTIRRFDEQVLGGSKWVIGLSGGLDSSVVAALLVRALGSENVVAYNLATRYNAQATKDNAARLANSLGIDLKNGSIEGLVKATGETVERYGYAPESYGGLVLENVQARIRGHLLSTFAALEGGVVVNNGNRVECALGYATLYGDAIGALCPIASLTKVQLFKLARGLNALYGEEVIPGSLLPVETESGLIWDVMPSAELYDGQKDPMKWFYHDWLISKLDDEGADAASDVLAQYLEDKLASTEVGKWIGYYGLDDPAAFVDDLEWVVKSMRRATFKRIQSPPRINVLPSGYAASHVRQGNVEQGERYLELRELVLRDACRL